MNRYVDIHTHVLQEQTCGPQNAAESLSMLRQLSDHGVKTAAATPFFHPQTQSLDDFLAARDAAFSALSPLIEESAMPSLVTGAVVELCPAVLQCKGLERLQISDTDYALVKIPENTKIDDALLSLFDHFRIASRLNPILCEVDALFSTANVQDMLTLQQAGALLQISCAGILQHDTRKLSLYLLGNHIAQFVGSGYRNPADSPQLIEAMRVLKRSLPLEKYKRIKNNAGMLMSGAERSALIGG